MVIASVFAWTVVTTGVGTARTSQQITLNSLAESSAPLVLRGAVVGTANADGTALDNVKFMLSSGGESVEAADLSGTGTIISYLDKDQTLILPDSQWSTTWLIGSGPLLDLGEVVVVQVALTGLDPALGARRDFTIRVNPVNGSALLINRTTPVELTHFVDLTPG